MTREEMKKLLESPIAKAWAEGKEVEYEPIQNARVIPNDVSPLEIVSTPWKFRIKPKPREFWLIKDPGDATWQVWHASPMNVVFGTQIVHVREVLE